MSNAVAAPSTHSIKDLLALVAAREPGTRRLLTGVTWNEYLHLNDSFVDPPNLRMSFIEGTLEITALGLPHEKYSRFLSAVLRLLADELEFDLEEVGSTTLRLEILELVQGEYQPCSTSLAFPFLQANDLTAFIEQSLVEGQSKTLRDFRAWVKAHKPEKTN